MNRLKPTLITALVLSTLLGSASFSLATEEPVAPPSDISMVAGPGEPGGGGYIDDRNGSGLLKEAAEDLAREVRALPAHRLGGVPAEWTPERIARVIENVRTDTRPETLLFQRDGRMLNFNFDRESGTITALAAFFLQNAVPNWQRASEEHLRDVKLKLLHEASHLWFFNQTQATRFANDTMSLISHNVIMCRHKAKKGEKPDRVTFIYSFADETVYFLNHVRSFDVGDEGYPEIPTIESAPVRYLDAKATIRPDSITVSQGTDGFRFEVSRNTDDEMYSHGRAFYSEREQYRTDCISPTYGIPTQVPGK